MQTICYKEIGEDPDKCFLENLCVTGGSMQAMDDYGPRVQCLNWLRVPLFPTIMAITISLVKKTTPVFTNA